MSEANPLDLVKSLRDTLEAYLPTTLPVSRRYPLLAEEFRALLKKQPLVKGPYVEALPDFEKGRKQKTLGLATTCARRYNQIFAMFAGAFNREILVLVQFTFKPGIRQSSQAVVETTSVCRQ